MSMELLPYIRGKLEKTVFGDSDIVDIPKFKDKSSDIRLGGKDWAAFMKDLEEARIVRMERGKIRLIK